MSKNVCKMYENFCACLSFHYLCAANRCYARAKLFIALVLCFVYIAASAQEITGVVTESTTGEPIPYMNIFYDGKVIGTISDVDGNFTLPLHPEWKKLTFSAVGYVKKTITISSSTRRLKVKIQPDDVQLSEVVVKPKKQKYSRKNNPAVELMKKVIAAKKQSDLAQHDFFLQSG